MSYFQPYLPGPGELGALLACGVVLAGFLAIGALVGRSRRPGLEAMLAGWGLVACVPALGQWFVPVNLPIYGAAVGVLALASAWVCRRSLAGTPLWRPAVLLMPALVVACGVPLDEWDSFSHWGINAAWLWRHETLPWPGLPLSPSSNPDYPYGYPLALYFASLLRGAYIPNAGAIVNVMVLVGVAATLARLAAGDDARRRDARPWLWSAWGVLATLVLNPGFVRSTTLATYADTVFAATLMAVCLALWRLAEAGRDRWAGAWMTAAALALAVVNVKESGLIALGVIATAVVLVALRDPVVRRGLGRLLTALLPAALAGLAWQQYTAGWLPSSFSILPAGQWRFHLLPDLARSAGAVVADHGVYYVLLVTVVALGTRGWWRAGGRVDRFLALVALVVMGHLATVFLAYMGASFTEAEVARAASLHRYATQVGLLVVAAAVLVLGRRAAARGRGREPAGNGAAGRWLVAACVAVMLAGAPYLYRERTDFETFFLQHGRMLADGLPEGSSVALLGWRELPLAYFLLRYEMFRPGREDRDLSLVRVFEPLAGPGPDRRQQLQRLARRQALDYLLIIGEDLHGEGGPDMLLLARDGAAWRKLDAWLNE